METGEPNSGLRVLQPQYSRPERDWVLDLSRRRGPNADHLESALSLYALVSRLPRSSGEICSAKGSNLQYVMGASPRPNRTRARAFARLQHQPSTAQPTA